MMQESDSRYLPFLVLSAFLFLTAGFLQSLSGPEAIPPKLLFVAAASVLVLTLVRAAAQLRHAAGRVRQLAEPGPSGTWLLLGLILMVAAAALGLQSIRFDATERKIHELSQTSKDALAEVESDIEMVAFVRDNDQLRLRVDAMLDAYRTTVSNIRTRRIDPEREPDKAREYGTPQINTILVRAGDATEVVDELLEPDVTQAILRVEDPRRPTVAFTIDHGEFAPDRPGFTNFRSQLIDSGIDVGRLDSNDLINIPDHIRVVVVAGPTTALLPGEVQAIERFLIRGGRLAAFLDPGVESGLEDLLESRGILLPNNEIIDEGQLSRALELGDDAVAIAALGLADHEITRQLAAGVVLRSTREVSLAPKPIFGTNGIDILKTGNRAVPVEPGTRTANGPRRVHSAATALEWEANGPRTPADGVAERPYGRIVVVGDSDFLRDDLFGLYGNPAFASRVFGWLTEREFLLKFPTFNFAGTPLKVSGSGLTAIFYLQLVVFPLLAFAFGFFQWIRRR